MNVLELPLIVVATLSALWWAFARHRAPVALEWLSLAGLGLAVLATALEGVHWQLVPWQLLALACAVVALLRRQRLARSRRVVRVFGRAALVLGIFAGGLGLLAARVPQLPRPSGPHLVGSVVFHWTDAQRPETFATSAGERRQVVAQAWYPTETPGPPVPYFEAQGRLPAYVDPYPAWFYGDFDKVDTHASASPPVSAERPTWPVLVFLPGWGSPREDYSALCADLASRGYVVVALSHPYESAVSVLADGRVVGTAAGASILGANMADMTRSAPPTAVSCSTSSAASRRWSRGPRWSATWMSGTRASSATRWAGPPPRRWWRRTPDSWSASTSTAPSRRCSRAAGTWVRPSCGCRVMASSRRATCRCATGSSPGCPAATCWSWAAPATRASPICPPTGPHWGGD